MPDPIDTFDSEWHRIVAEKDRIGLERVLAEDITVGVPPYWQKLHGRTIAVHLRQGVHEGVPLAGGAELWGVLWVSDDRRRGRQRWPASPVAVPRHPSAAGRHPGVPDTERFERDYVRPACRAFNREKAFRQRLFQKI